MKKFYFLLSIFFLVSEALAAHAAWEKINGFSREFYFIDHSEQFLTVTVQSTTGKNLYLLSMGINAWDFANNDFEYSGDFECRLTKVGGGYSEDLLWDDPHASSDSEGRGRFMQAQLQGRCWDYPDYGHDRYYRLRGMKIRIDVLGFSLGQKISYGNTFRIGGLRCLVTVVNDNGAKSSFAEKSGYLEPPKLHPEVWSDLTLNCRNIELLNRR